MVYQFALVLDVRPILLALVLHLVLLILFLLFLFIIAKFPEVFQ